MQSVQTPIQAVITAATRQLNVTMLASWLKVADLSVSYATIGVSSINGVDLIQGESAVITNADLFAYMDESAYVMRFDYDRKVTEPLGGTSFAIADFLLDNISGRFTPNKNATIGTAIEARRPVKASIGLSGNGTFRSRQIIVGLTADRPRTSRGEQTTEVQVFDYITFIDNQTIAAAIYENQRSDQIIADILTTLGFGSSQYALDTGINTIPFAWFDKGMSAGKRIRLLCEAEEAHFYQDENGILRFENRNHYDNFPHQTVQHTIDPGDVLFDEQDDSTKIINRAIVIAKPRTVDSIATTIWTSSEVPIEIAAGATTTIWAAFYDDQAGQTPLPIKEITTPAENTDYEANTASDGSGSDVSADIDVTVTNFVESAKIEVTNNNAGTVYVTLLQLRGKAARVSQAIQAIAEDTGSINKFEAQEFVVSNDLIQTPSVAQTIADNLVAKYANPLSRRKVKIPGIPHLQLKDLVAVVNPRPVNLIPNPSLEGNADNWELQAPGRVTSSFTRVSTGAIPEGFYVGQITIS